MRILYDARSVRTPTGRYVLEGLARGWLADSRVERVVIAWRNDGTSAPSIPGADVLVAPASGWITYLSRDLPRLANEIAADVIFSPNATAPRDPRVVLNYQDLYHFRVRQTLFSAPRLAVAEGARALWRSSTRSAALLEVAVSRHMASTAARGRSMPTVIPNGVDVPFGWAPERDVVTILGGTGARKGESVALRAWALLPENARGVTRLEVVGAEPASRREELMALSRELGIDDSVTVSGAISREEFLRRLATARLSVACSSLESFSLPVAEALAMGAPLLCSDIPAHMELLERAGAGAAYRLDDVRALARALGEALSGAMPRTLVRAPSGWNWLSRAREHVDAYLRALGQVVRASADGASIATPSLTHVRH